MKGESIGVVGRGPQYQALYLVELYFTKNFCVTLKLEEIKENRNPWNMSSEMNSTLQCGSALNTVSISSITHAFGDSPLDSESLAGMGIDLICGGDSDSHGGRMGIDRL